MRGNAVIVMVNMINEDRMRTLREQIIINLLVSFIDLMGQLSFIFDMFDKLVSDLAVFLFCAILPFLSICVDDKNFKYPFLHKM